MTTSYGERILVLAYCGIAGNRGPIQRVFAAQNTKKLGNLIFKWYLR